MNPLFRYTVRALALAVVCVLATSCQEPIPSSRRPDDTGVIGRYTIKHKKKDPALSIQFNRNRTFEADFNGDGEIDTTGTFEITRNRISLVNTEAVVCKALRGVYVYHLDGVEMTFEEVLDECGQRKSAFSKTWILQ